MRRFREGDRFKNGDIVVREVCHGLGISLEMIKVKSRKKHLVEARQIVIDFLRWYTGLSLQEIADTVGLADHSSIVFSLKAYNGKLKQNDFLLKVQLVKRTLREKGYDC